MRPEDVLYWLRGQPFRPFRIILVSGETRDVRHPELVRLLRTSMVFFTPTNQEDVYERGEMLGLMLIERIEPIDSPATV